jgi:integrase/recombinase XerC
MRQTFLSFLRDLDLSKGRSSRTCEIYRQILKQFDIFLAEQEESEELARAYLRTRAKEVSANTQSLEVAALRSFSRWRVDQERSFPKRFAKIWNLKTPKISKKLIRVFSEEDMGLLLKTISEVSSHEQMLFYLLYGSGLRISEALNLEEENINFQKKTIRVLGKGSRWREVPVLDEFLEIFSRSCSIKDAETSKTWHKGEATYALARKWILNWGKASGLHEKYGVLHPHKLRHALASHLLRRGARLPHIQKLLGHKHLSTTQKYTHLELEDLLKAYDKALPAKLAA